MSAMDKIFINELLIQCIIGVNKGERKKKQNIVVNLTIFYDISTCGRTDNIQHTIDYSAISKRMYEYAETAAHYTLEALSAGIARTIFAEWPQINELIVRVDKPSALYLAKSPAVEIHRNRTWFYMEQQNHKDELEKLQRKSVPSVNPSDRQSVVKQQLNQMQEQVSQLGLSFDSAIVYVALGSNIGEKLKNIHQALTWLQNTSSTPSKFVRLLETSFLYQTAPQYVLDQPSFLNCVCKIVTNFDPDDLLLHLQSIEVEMGRQKLIRFGPRNIDLDIVFYNNIVYNSKKQDLIIPHPRMFERDFVLGPLMDLCPDLIHPTLHKTVREMFAQLQLNTLQRILPVNDNTIFILGSKTFIMGVLNVTPDSFSDGGQFNETQKAVERAKQMVQEGADIIDVGGQSTRPGQSIFCKVDRSGAILISAEEELSRVIPVIRGIKEQLPNITISIDTFYSKVAKEAIQAGAAIVNDVSGGTMDSDMFSVCASLKVPIVIMHMKGTPQTMSSLAKYDEVAAEVQQALKTQAELAIKSGVYRWNIVLDPGIGFAKTAEHNLELLRPRASLTPLTFPLLYGTSRKGFIGKITGKSDPSQRRFGTAATITAAIQLGADFLRLHDIAEMKDVILVSDAIYRQNWKEPAPQNNDNAK